MYDVKNGGKLNFSLTEIETEIDTFLHIHTVLVMVRDETFRRMECFICELQCL